MASNKAWACQRTAVELVSSKNALTNILSSSWETYKNNIIVNTLKILVIYNLIKTVIRFKKTNLFQW